MRAIEVIGFHKKPVGYIVEHDNFVRYFNANCYKPGDTVPTKQAIIVNLNATTRNEVEYMMYNKCRNTKRDRNYFTRTFNAIYNTL